MKRLHAFSLCAAIYVVGAFLFPLILGFAGDMAGIEIGLAAKGAFVAWVIFSAPILIVIAFEWKVKP